MAYLYILYSSTLDRYYVGHTTQRPEERLRKHLAHHDGFTARANDWTIVYTEAFSSKNLAFAREKQIKAWKSKLKIRELVQNNHFP